MATCERCGLQATPGPFEEKPHTFPEQCVTALVYRIAAVHAVLQAARDVADFATHVPGSPEGASPGLRAEVRRLRAALDALDATITGA